MYIENKQLKNYISIWLQSMFWIIAIMIVVGGLTRLTDSGLSITKWQLFSGFLPPFNDSQWLMYFDLYKKIPEFKLQNYDMSLNEFKVIFWWEWAHRFLGRLIGLMFLIPLVFFFLKLGFSKTKNYFIIFALICFQGFIGWYMVSSGLIDRIDVSHYRLSLHLFIAFLILSLIFWNFLKINNFTTSEIKINIFLPIIFIILIFLQIIIGAFVAGMDAGKIYNTWPFMGLSYYPDDNSIDNFFKLSVFDDPSLVQFIHRNLAYIIFIFYLLISFISYKKKIKFLKKSLVTLGLLLFFQIFLGVMTLLYSAQILLASMHQISSIFLVTSSVYFLYINTNTN